MKGRKETGMGRREVAGCWEGENGREAREPYAETPLRRPITFKKALIEVTRVFRFASVVLLID
ncbi:hypothetical protein E2C01_079927 [Portunus trituberculatus]|uniref:Uncharacterized protein n=1 Tax=Portunus trituberculatus TaxID=210409 RepID=A0A5B7IY75_PORTR|nr:hypothetical protein [Portunus trituberculatus]